MQSNTSERSHNSFPISAKKIGQKIGNRVKSEIGDKRKMNVPKYQELTNQDVIDSNQDIQGQTDENLEDLGEILISLNYKATSNAITIGIEKAKNLPALDLDGFSGTGHE